MKKTDLDSMSTDELWALHEKIASILSTRISILSTRMETEKLKLEHRLEQIKSKTLDDIPERRAFPKIHPRFRNPDPPYQTWSGRGKQPTARSMLFAICRSLAVSMASYGCCEGAALV
jgi:DNA-binding protein H-NS